MENSNLKLENFLDGHLGDNELKSFLKELEENNDLSKELKFRLEINQLIRDKGFFELHDKLSIQLNNIDSNNPIINLGKDLLRTWHMAAASFALILVVGGLWYILSNKPYSTEKLVLKYYKPAHPILQIRSVDANNDDALGKAFEFYKENDYNNALMEFSKIENQITSKFYSGICYIELQQYDKASEAFSFIINDNNNLFVEQADWYLGLIYMMDNQKNKAINQFTKINLGGGFYSAQANEIIKYLN